MDDDHGAIAEYILEGQQKDAPSCPTEAPQKLITCGNDTTDLGGLQDHDEDQFA